MERKNFFTSGWLFLTIAIVNIAVAAFFSPLIMSHPGHFDEWFGALICLIPMSIALAIVGGLVPRRKIGVKRLLTVIFDGLAALLYMASMVAIIAYWAQY